MSGTTSTAPLRTRQPPVVRSNDWAASHAATAAMAKAVRLVNVLAGRANRVDARLSQPPETTTAAAYASDAAAATVASFPTAEPASRWRSNSAQSLAVAASIGSFRGLPLGVCGCLSSCRGQRRGCGRMPLAHRGTAPEVSLDRRRRRRLLVARGLRLLCPWESHLAGRHRDAAWRHRTGRQNDPRRRMPLLSPPSTPDRLRLR